MPANCPLEAVLITELTNLTLKKLSNLITNTLKWMLSSKLTSGVVRSLQPNRSSFLR